MPDAPATTEPASAPRRYRGPPIALHWVIALLILVQVGLGLWFNEVLPDDSPAQKRLEVLHIQIGLTILLLVLARIAARLFWPAPPLPSAIPRGERRLAQSVHGLLYVLMVVVPLSGFILVSARKAPIPFWGLTWPHLPGVTAWGAPDPKPVRAALKHLHVFWLAGALVIAIALHVAGALKHQLDGRPVLWRMLPFLKRPAGAREAAGDAS